MEKIKEIFGNCKETFSKLPKNTKIIAIGGSGVLVLALIGAVVVATGDSTGGNSPVFITTDAENVEDSRDQRETDPPDVVVSEYQVLLCGTVINVLTGEEVALEDVTCPDTRRQAESVIAALLTESDIDETTAETTLATTVTTTVATSPVATTPGETTPATTTVATTTGTTAPRNYTNVITLRGGERPTADASNDCVRVDSIDNGAWRISIRRPGRYTINGTMNNGIVVVGRNDGFPGGEVHLTLNNVNITNNAGPAIRATSRVGSLIVYSPAGTTNNLTDTRAPRLTDEELEETNANEDTLADNNNRNAALFTSETPLTVTGSGTLNLRGGHAHGIHARGTTLTVSNTNLNVQSAHANGLRSRHAMVIDNSRLNLNVNRKGLRVAGAQHGNLTIRNGSILNITSRSDAVHAEVNVNILGNSNITATVGGGFGRGNNVPADIGSRRGIRATGNIVITGGTFVLDVAEDGINASGSTTVNNATLRIAAHNRGIRGQSGLTLNNTTTTIAYSRLAFHGGGVRGSHVTINGGRTTAHFLETVNNMNLPRFTHPDNVNFSRCQGRNCNVSHNVS
ncbi:MAG: carbohydrate-binding domain-containing protein [Oscillospiraceae bacterium]|nr:carbohydrate-binding domain-containing protein [Oscillospiraceae bacterium]